MAQKFYKIVDKNGYEMPGHYSGRNRTYEEAKKMVDNLNKNGEHRPYTMIETQQTAVDWFFNKLSEKTQANNEKEYYQAKQMEKEQIVDAYEQGSSDEIVAYDGTRDFKHGLNYYNETYEGQGSPDTSHNTQNK